MRSRRSALPWTLLWLGLLFQSLRPFGPLQRAVELATAPLRLVAEVASPLTVLRFGRVSAAEQALEAGAEAAARENVRLLGDLARGALPTEERLVSGRRFVHAEVLGHEDASRDHLRVRLRDPRGVSPGMPVACGDAFVGRVERLARAGEPADLAIVALVTGAEFHTGAVVERPRREEAKGQVAVPGEVVMTVGGVATARGSGRRAEFKGLATYYPSDRTITGGLARVRELFDDEARFPSLAEGLRLGEVRHDEAELWIEPELDYKDGLFQVVVVTPPLPGIEEVPPYDAVLFDGNWVRTRPLTTGDPSPSRSTRKVRVGARQGVVEGAAVTSIGAHLVGRVLRAGITTSDVALLDDPGFSLVAVARFEGFEEPQVLGRMIALGRDEETGAHAFRWVVRASLDPALSEKGGTRAARLYTGSGDAGLPAGFSFGSALLPLDARSGQTRRVLVRADVEPEDVATLFVRTEGGAP